MARSEDIDGPDEIRDKMNAIRDVINELGVAQKRIDSARRMAENGLAASDMDMIESLVSFEDVDDYIGDLLDGLEALSEELEEEEE